MAVFKRLSPDQFRLERSTSNHLLLPKTAFAGRENVQEESSKRDPEKKKDEKSPPS